MTRVAIVQSNYIPWKGYFDLIASVDAFVLLDDVQYTRRDWRNRDRLKTAEGTRWLSIPIHSKGRYLQRIDETEVSDTNWAEMHWRALVRAYGTAAGFEEVRDRIELAYQECSEEKLLSRVNRRFIGLVCGLLGVSTPLTWSTEYCAAGTKTERLRDLCLSVGADEYLSGPSARGYLDERLLADAGISVVWMDYYNYPEYPQLHPPFEHHVTVLDLIFNTGMRASSYMKAAAINV
jgi:hypothetical protein